MSLERFFLSIAAAALLSGCHLFSKLTPDCHSPQEYMHAGQVPPLKVPAGLDSPNTQGALVIPTVELAAAHHETVLRAMRAAGVTLEEQAA